MSDTEISPKFYEFMEAATRHIRNYTIGFVKFEGEDEATAAHLAGSGTLVTIDNMHAILTADHVLKNLPNSGFVGLVLPSTSPVLHRVTIDMKLTEKICVGRGSNPADGPDLGLLILPEAEAAILDARQSFFNLTKRRDRMLSDCPEYNRGTWVLSGWADEWSVEGPAQMGYERTYGFHGFSGFGIVTEEKISGDFDYLSYAVDYNTEGYPGPQSFEGFSGGGLWQAILRDEGDKISADEWLFSGVAFYQSGIEQDNRNINCHGRISVYRAAINEMRKAISNR